MMVAARPGSSRKLARAVIVAGGLLLAGNLVVIAAVTQRNEGNEPGVPSAIEQLIPEPGTVIRPQEDVGADLRDDLIGVLRIDGRPEIPEDQYRRVVDLGRVTFRPGPGRDIGALEPGAHTATVTWWSRISAREKGTFSYTWHFKVG